MDFKEGTLVEFNRKALTAFSLIEAAYRSLGYTCTLTAGHDGKHMTGSLHYRGLAWDFRTNHVNPIDLTTLKDRITLNLGREYDVVMEGDHLHVEHDVKH